MVDIKPGENGAPLMVPKAELNTDRAAHSSGITRAAEVLCTAVNTSVLITGDAVGTLAVRVLPPHHLQPAPRVALEHPGCPQGPDFNELPSCFWNLCACV